MTLRGGALSLDGRSSQGTVDINVGVAGVVEDSDQEIEPR
jgi:hypothetical protein